MKPNTTEAMKANKLPTTKDIKSLLPLRVGVVNTDLRSHDGCLIASALGNVPVEQKKTIFGAIAQSVNEHAALEAVAEAAKASVSQNGLGSHSFNLCAALANLETVRKVGAK